MPSPQSSDSQSGSVVKPLTAEQQEALNRVPDVIGDEPISTSGSRAVAAEIADAGELQPGSELMGMIGDEIVDEEDMGKLLEFVGDTLAKWRKVEAYRDAGARAGKLASRPWAQVANHVWQTYAPQIFTSMCNSVPGLSKALMMTAIAFTPAIMADVEQTRTRPRSIVEGSPAPAAGPQPVRNVRPTRPPSGGLVWDEGAAN